MKAVLGDSKDCGSIECLDRDNKRSTNQLGIPMSSLPAVSTAPASTSIDLFAAFATNEKLEIEGTLTQIPGAGDTEFLVARGGNKHYNRLIQKLVKQNKFVLDSKGDTAEAKSDEIFIQVLAKTVLLGWNGTINIRGVATPYSYDAAVKLLEMKEFRIALNKVADDMQTFKAVKDEEDAKN